jgi:hypothetical protein
MTTSGSNKGTKSADEAAHQAELDQQIARMREMLDLMAPGSGATALGAMRKAFPDAPLSERVQALKTYR